MWVVSRKLASMTGRNDAWSILIVYTPGCIITVWTNCKYNWNRFIEITRLCLLNVLVQYQYNHVISVVTFCLFDCLLNICCTALLAHSLSIRIVTPSDGGCSFPHNIVVSKQTMHFSTMVVVLVVGHFP